MKFRVIYKKTSLGAPSPVQVVEQSTGKVLRGSIGISIASMSAEFPTRLCTPMHIACCRSSAGGKAFISAADLIQSALFDYVRFQVQARRATRCLHHQRPHGHRRTMPGNFTPIYCLNVAKMQSPGIVRNPA
jgi:hypothetical protein